MEKKNDVQASVMYSGGDGNNGIGDRRKNEGLDAQLAFALSDHIALRSDYFGRKETDFYNSTFRREREVFDSSLVNYHRKMTGLGIGYFSTDIKKSSIGFSIYTGVELGSASMNDQGIDDAGAAYTRKHHVKIFRYYLEPGLNIKATDNFTVSYAIRLSFLHYYNINTDYTAREQAYFGLNELGKGLADVLEQGITLQYNIPGAKWLMIKSNLSIVTLWSSKRGATRSINGSAGIGFNLSKRTKK